MKELNPWVLLAILAGGGAALMVYTKYANDAADTSWTDPHQPPPMVAEQVAGVGGRPCRSYGRVYPDSLGAWDGTVVGDC